MEFEWPGMLLLLLLAPLLVLAYLWAQRRRKRYALRFASLSVVKEAMGRGPGWRRHVPPALFLTGLTILLFSLARPLSVVTLPSQEGTIILAIDSSGSMRAEDMAPTRLDAAKAAARTFVERQPEGVRIGVVSFSDSSFLVQAPTDDKQAVLGAINRLTWQRGTAIGSAMLTSLDAIFEEADAEGGMMSELEPTPTPVPRGIYEPAIIILLSDGQSNRGPRPLEVVQEAVDRGVRIYTVGVGTERGAVLNYRGRSMRVQLDETTLKGIADATGGDYYNASSESELQAIYQNLGMEIVFRQQEAEITAIFAAIGAVFVLAAGVLSMLWFSRIL